MTKKRIFLFNEILATTSNKKKILRPISQWPPLPEVMHNAMLPWILEKTSPIADSRSKVLISSLDQHKMPWIKPKSDVVSVTIWRKKCLNQINIGCQIFVWLNRFQFEKLFCTLKRCLQIEIRDFCCLKECVLSKKVKTVNFCSVKLRFEIMMCRFELKYYNYECTYCVMKNRAKKWAQKLTNTLK